MALYDKPVKLLFRDMIRELSIKRGDVLERGKVILWFKKKYPLIKPATLSAHFLKLSTNAPSRIHYNLDQNGKDDLLYQIDSQKFRIYEKASDPDPIYSKLGGGDSSNSNAEASKEESEFAYEKDLQNFLAKNLSLIEPDLTLYMEDDISGIEFPAGSRFIDILATDKDNNYVVIELKVSKGYDKVVGQIMRYMGWIRKYHADEKQQVRGIILAREISDDLLLACSEIKSVDLYEYTLSVSVTQKAIGGY